MQNSSVVALLRERAVAHEVKRAIHPVGRLSN
jgi:hypothetical protein